MRENSQNEYKMDSCFLVDVTRSVETLS